MSVYEGVEGEAVPPAGGEVLDVDLRVPGERANIFATLRANKVTRQKSGVNGGSRLLQ